MQKSKTVTVPALEALIGREFNDPELGWQALQGKQALSQFPLGNKRLALYGDAIIRYHAMKKWYYTGTSTGKSGPNAPSKCKKDICSNKQKEENSTSNDWVETLVSPYLEEILDYNISSTRIPLKWVLCRTLWSPTLWKPS